MPRPRYLVVPTSGTRLGSSLNGSNFTQTDAIPGMTSGANHLEWFTNDRLWVLAGCADGVCKRSADGLTWTTITTGFEGSGYSVARIIKHGSVWIAIGRGPTNIAVSTSPDLVTWTIRTTAFDGSNPGLYDIATNGSTVIIVGYAGAAPTVQYSTNNGATWTTSLTFGVGVTNLNAATYSSAAGLFMVAGGAGGLGTVYTSPDGINWSSQTPPVADQIIDLSYANGVILATTANKLWTSTNGTNWTERTGHGLTGDIYTGSLARALDTTHAFAAGDASGKVSLSDRTGTVWTTAVDAGVGGVLVRGIGAIPTSPGQLLPLL